MKRCILCAFLLCTLPAFATISQWQAPASQWNSSPQSTCSMQFGSTSQKGDLFVVWTFWTSPSQLTASVADSPFGNSFVSAVGPTVQSATATPTYAQIFYAKNIGVVPGQKDTITVTYNGSAQPSTSGCVFVEYQDADTQYPLDSVSEAISNEGSPSSTLDSGTASPANASLLVFGGANVDLSSAPVVGSGFTSVASNSSGSSSVNSSLTEQMIVSGNAALQRATAATAATLPPAADWLMQMAVFRAASWTTAQGTSSTRSHGVVDTSQFPGAPDIGAQVNNAYAGCPPLGCAGSMPPVSASFSVPVVANTQAKPLYLFSPPSTALLTFTSTSETAATLAWGSPGGAPANYLPGGGISGLKLIGSGGSSVGVSYGDGTNGVAHSVIDKVMLSGFGTNLSFPTSGTASWGSTIRDSIIFNGATQNVLLTGGPTIENTRFFGGLIGNGPIGLNHSASWSGDVNLFATSLDSHSAYADQVQSGAFGVDSCFGCHWEDNGASSTYLNENSSNYTVNIFGGETLKDSTASATQLFNVNAGKFLMVGGLQSAAGTTSEAVNVGSQGYAMLIGLNEITGINADFSGTGTVVDLNWTFPQFRAQVAPPAGGYELMKFGMDSNFVIHLRNDTAGVEVAMAPSGAVTMPGTVQANANGPVSETTLTGTCGSSTEGQMAAVKDSLSNAWGTSIFSGTGSYHVLAYCDGTNWTVAAK